MRPTPTTTVTEAMVAAVVDKIATAGKFWYGFSSYQRNLHTHTHKTHTHERACVYLHSSVTHTIHRYQDRRHQLLQEEHVVAVAAVLKYSLW